MKYLFKLIGRKTYLYGAIFVMAIFAIFTLSCEIGLGNAVDTEPPVLKITSPVSDAVIRDAFRMAGTWSDDGTIKSLSVTLESPEGDISYGPFTGVCSVAETEGASNTWYCVIDPITSKIPDGSYEAKISITDEANHTTSQARLLIIDNTAPIIVLQRPSAKLSDSEPDSYGQTFTLEGQAADDNDVSLIRMNFYSDKECTNLVHYVDLTNVPPTISLDVAKFGEDDYTKIYGSTSKDGEKQYYCTIAGYDGAARYPTDGSNQTAADLLGNVTSSYYLYDDIDTEILSDHKITEVYHMLNGTYSSGDSSRTASTTESVLKILKKYAVTQGSFSLNPENNPTFTVSGRNVLKKDGTDFSDADYSISNGNSAVIDVAPGLDGIYIRDDETFKVYIQLCDANGDVAEDAEKIYPTNVTKKASGSSYKFVVPLSTKDGLKIGKNYVFGFDGADKKGNAIIGNGGSYGFHLASSGAAPDLVITEPAETSIIKSKGTSVVIKGYTEVEEGLPTVQILNGSDVLASKTFTEADAAASSERKHFDFEFEISADNFSQDTTNQYTLSTQASYDGLKSTQNKTIVYDVKFPEVKTFSVTPKIDEFNGNAHVINKKTRFSGMVTDDYILDSVRYEFVQNETVKTSGTLDSVFSNVEIDTEANEIAEGAASIVIYAKDTAGQETKYIYDCYVDQRSDIPVVKSKSTKLDLSYSDVSALSATGAVNRFSKNGESLPITITDDDGVSSGMVTIKNSDGTFYDTDQPSVDYNSCTLPTSTGTYQLVLDVTDSEGTEYKNLASFWIMVTGNNPEVTASLSPEYVNTNAAEGAKLTVSVEVVNEGATSYEVYIDGNKEGEIASKADSSNYTWSGEITLAKGTVSGSKLVEVKDIGKGLSTKKTVSYKVDNASPTVTLLAPSPSATISGNNSLSDESFTFSGRAEDESSGSGVNKLYFAFTGSDSTPADAAWFSQEAYNGRWNIAANLTESGTVAWDNSTLTLPQGHYYFHVKATDAAGNAGTITAKEIYVDSSAPVVTAAAPVYVNAQTDSGKRTVSLSGKITESYGLKSFEIYRGTEKIKTFTLGTEIANAPANADWTYTDTPSADGTYTYKFIATDLAGKTNAILEKTVTVDTAAPKTDISKVTLPSNKDTENSLFKFMGAAGSVTDSAVSSGFEKLSAAFTSTTTAPSSPDFTLTPAEDGSWNQTVGFADYSIFETQGTKYFWYKITDNAGNESAWASKIFVYDTAAPSITETKLGSDGTYQKANFTLGGTASDSYGISKVEITSDINGYSFTSEGTTPTLTLNTSTGVWSKTFTLAQGKSADGNTIKDGNYTFTIKVTDKSEKTNTLKRTLTVDTTKPVLAVPSVTNAAGDIHTISGTKWYSNKTIKLSAAPADTDGSGVKTVSYTTVAASRTDGDWTDFTNNGDGTYTANVVFANDGNHTIYFKTSDNAGNITGDDDSVKLAVNIDTTAPDLQITSSIPVYMGSKGFEIAGTALDAAPACGKVTLTVKEEHKASGAADSTYAVTSSSGAEITVGTDGSWTKTLPLSGTPSEGTYRYTLTLTDGTGNSVESEAFTTIVDKTAPKAAISSPADGSIISETYPQFTGTFTEDVRLKNVYYKFAGTAQTAATTADLADWSTATKAAVSGTNKAWDFYQNFKANTSTGAGLGEGSYVLSVIAADEAGNLSTAASYSYKVDMAAPVVTETSQNAEETYVKRAVDGDGNVIRDVVLGGKITESNGLTSFVIKRNGVQVKAFTLGTELVSNPDDAAWSWTDTTLTTDGTYTYTIEAKDAAGRSNTALTRKVTVDTTIPAANASKITVPTNLETENSLFKFTGADACVSDSGDGASGLDYVEIAFSKTETGTKYPAAGITVTPAAAGSWSSTIEYASYSDVFGTKAAPVQGDKWIWLKAYDKAGNESAWVSKKFVYDTAAPAVTETTLGSDGSYKNATFTLGGTASDSYGISKVEITSDINGYSFTSEGTTPTLTLNTATGAWSKTITLREQNDAANTVKDGSYTFTIKVTDKADKTNEITRKVVVDTTKPAGSFNADSYSPKASYTNSGKDWYKKDAVTFNLAVTESNISVVEGTSDEDYENTTNYSGFTLSGTNYAGTLSGLSEGQNTITVRMTDKAGNIAYAQTNIYVDTSAPETIAAYDSTGTAVPSTRLTNGKNDIVVYVEPSDANSGTDKSTGIAAVQLGNGTKITDKVASGTNAGRYEITIPKDSQSGALKIKVYDNAGNEATLSPFSFKLDTAAPSVEITIPTETEASGGLNGSVNITGTVTDGLTSSAGVDGSLKSIVLEYALGTESQTAAPTTGWYELDDSTDEISCTTSRETFDVTRILSTQTKMLKVSDGALSLQDDTTNATGYVWIRATATDAADWTSSAARKIKINRNADRPQVYLTTITVPSDMSAAKSISEYTGTINGTVSDDDGAISTITVTPYTSTDNGTTWNAEGSSTTVTVNNGSWKYTFPKDSAGKFKDGLWKLEMEMSDGTTTFKSSNSSVLVQPRLFGASDSGYTEFAASGTTTKTDIYITLDTNKPVYSNFAYSTDGTTWNTNYTSKVFGGITQSFSVKIDAEDINGIESVKASFGNQTKTGTTSAANGNGTWTIENLSAAKTNVTTDGSTELKVTVTDKTGNSNEFTAQLNVDNTEPEITISAPDSTQYSSGNITAYGTVDSVTTMYYALSLDDTTTPGADDANKGTAITLWMNEDDTTGENAISYQPYYKQINGASLAWYVYFDDGVSSSTATHEMSLKNFLIESGVTTKAAIENKTFTNIVKLWLWVKAVDTAGNEAIEKHLILADPQGDAPKVTIDYPEADGTTLGGLVTLRGTATDTIGTNIGVDSVWVQIVSDSKSITSVTLKDVKQWISNGYKVYTAITNAAPTAVTTAPTGADSADGSAYYIKATFSGSAWSLKINNNSEFNPASGEKKNVAYRVYAKDKDNTLSKVQSQYGIFDSDNPVISNLYLRQYASNDAGTGDITASREYSDDMWVKGVWWLCGEVEDTQGISALTVGGNSITVTGTAGATETFKVKLATGENGTAGNVEVPVIASDKVDEGATKHTTTRNCSINFDNKVPELVVSGSTFNISSTVQNSNGFYSFSSQVKEDPVSGKAQSGFSYLAFWFERDITGKHVVYDVMRSKANSEVAYSGLTEDSGLMWKSVTVTRSADALGTLTLSAADSNLHIGGLCKIGGSIYKISSVNSTEIGIDGQPEMPASGTTQTALFAVANVVDNTIEAGNGDKSTTDGSYGYYSTVSNDDGDHMVESVQKSGTTWTWEANINSQNIADGSATLHYVAFDAAGNYSTGTVAAKVANNAPRLASLKVWTDFNENNTEDAEEADTKYFSRKTRKVSGDSVYKATDVTSKLIVSGNDKDYENSGSAFMTVKAVTRFYPEIIGGNGDLYYSRKIGTASAIGSASATYGSAKFGAGHDDGIDDSADNSGYLITDDEGTSYVSGHTGYGTDDSSAYELTVSADDLGSLENGLTWFNYTIYDSTDGCAAWATDGSGTTGRLTAEFQVALNVQYNDKTPPQAWIRPFYWTKKGVPENGLDLLNSISWDINGKPEGHIELEKDLTSAITAATDGTTALGADDPKVSGKIRVEGYAFDDIKLKDLYVQFANHSVLNTATKVSTYTGGTWSKTDYSSETGWGFEAEDVYCNATGHRVHWILTVDTASRTTTSQLDQALVVYAVDARGTAATNTSVHNGTTQTTGTTDETMTYYYKMDIVPYITEIKTNLSKLDSTNPTAYSRTALGYYPVAENEKVEITGYNLKGATVYLDTAADPLTTKTATASSIPDVEIDENKSGTISVKVNGIESINGSDKATADYNIIDNGQNNATLNDDVKIKVWEFKTIADPVAVEQIQYPTVKMSPADGKIGASFSNSYYFHMPGYGNNGSSASDNYSHTPFLCGYDGADAGSFTFDKNGYAYGGVQYRASDLPSEGGSFNFVFSTAKPESDMSLADVYRCNTGSARLENNCTNLRTSPTMDKTEWSYNKWRVKSPQFVAVANDDSTSVTVYAAYYDSTTKQIRYRKGIVDAKDFVGNNTGFKNSGDTTSIGDTYMMLGGTNDSLKDIWHTSGEEREVTKTEEKVIYYEWYNESATPQYLYSKVSSPSTWGSDEAKIVYSDKDLTTVFDDSTNYQFSTNDNVLGMQIKSGSWSTTNYSFSDKKVETTTTTTIETIGGQKTTGGYVYDVYAYPGFTTKTGQGGGYDSNRGGDFGNRHVMAPDSLQTTNNQIIHVLASNGLTGDVQDIYKKEHYSNGAGQYVALGVLGGIDSTADKGKAVIAWYDNSTKHLLIAKEPDFTGNALNANAGTNFVNSYARTTAWEGKTIDLGSGGEYVQLVVDSADNIHIAHYDSSTGGVLKYIKLNSSMVIQEQVTVDSYDDVGSHLTINVGKDSSGNQVPYIGYYGRKHAKVAYRVNFGADTASGSTDKKIYTHNWEVSYVPTSDSISESLENTVNVAVWTNASGELKKSPYAANSTPATFNGNTAAAGNTVGATNVYANGTNNPVVAYVSASGSLEYAQIVGESTEILFN